MCTNVHTCAGQRTTFLIIRQGLSLAWDLLSRLWGLASKPEGPACLVLLAGIVTHS